MTAETDKDFRDEEFPFILTQTLGSGSNGQVKLGIHKVTGDKVAVKIINKNILTLSLHTKKKVQREIAVMKMIRHKHIIRLYDVLQTQNYLFLVMEYVEGEEFFDYFVEQGKLITEEAFHFFKQIFLGVEYCHKHLICHRDLKPENLLLDRYRNIKIADFTMATFMEEGKLLGTQCGSPHYSCPEIVKGLRYNGMEADVWSLGVILYALLTGRLPFDDENLHVLLAKVKEGTFEIPQFLDEDIRDLISKMLNVNPSERITIKGIKNHPWWRKMEKKMNLLEQRFHQAPSSDEISQQDSVQEKLFQHKLENFEAFSSELTFENQFQETIITREPLKPRDQDLDSIAKNQEENMTKPEETQIDPEVFQSTLGKIGLTEHALREALMAPEKNLEAALYNLILKYKHQLGTAAQTNLFNASKYTISTLHSNQLDSRFPSYSFEGTIFSNFSTQPLTQEIISTPNLSLSLELQIEEYLNNKYSPSRAEPIGGGGFGHVYKVTHPKRHMGMAIKVVHIRGDLSFNDVFQESLTMTKLSHPNIVNIYSAFTPNTTSAICIEMELMKGSLQDLFIDKKIKLSEQVLREITKQICATLSWLHREHKLLHRDIKPGNVLVKDFDLEQQSIHIALGDFGLAKSIDDLTNNTNPGTPPFMSPEIIRDQSPQIRYSEASDIFAVGVTLYQLLTLNTKTIVAFEVVCDPNFVKNKIGCTCSQEFAELISSMLKKDPSQRITALEVCDWLSERNPSRSNSTCLLA